MYRFGYVKFQNLADAVSALENLDMQVFEGRNMVVQYTRFQEPKKPQETWKFPKSEPSKCLYIGNMSFAMTDKDLNELFRTVKNVLDVRVALDRRTGQPRGFAHADFVDIPSATKALEELHGKIVYGRPLRLDYAHPGSKLNREQLASQHAELRAKARAEAIAQAERDEAQAQAQAQGDGQTEPQDGQAS
jgi:nucleolin